MTSFTCESKSYLKYVRLNLLAEQAWDSDSCVTRSLCGYALRALAMVNIARGIFLQGILLVQGGRLLKHWRQSSQLGRNTIVGITCAHSICASNTILDGLLTA